MRTKLKLDDKLLAQAREYDGNRDLSNGRLVDKAFRALIRRERLRRDFRMRMAEIRADAARGRAPEPRGGTQE